MLTIFLWFNALRTDISREPGPNERLILSSANDWLNKFMPLIPLSIGLGIVLAILFPSS